MTLIETLGEIEPRSFVRPSDFTEDEKDIKRFLNKQVIEGKLVNISNALYYKGVETRWGMTQPRIESSIAEVLKGTSYGYTSYTATNYLNVSTQVPARTHVAITGNTKLALPFVKTYHRSNTLRDDLSVLEVTIIEILRDYPMYVEDSWDSMVATLKYNIDYYNEIEGHSWKFDAERTAMTVAGERNKNTREMFDKFARSL